MGTLKNRDKCFIDLETTGLHQGIHEIIEFCGVRINPQGKRVGTLTLKIKPHFLTKPPPWAKEVNPLFDEEVWAQHLAFALNINGYTPEKWEGAYEWKDVALEILDFLKGSILIGQNISFDVGFINEKLRRAEITMPSRRGSLEIGHHKVDLMTLAYEHLVPLGLKSLSLSRPGGICDFLGIDTKDAHTAEADVEHTIEAYYKLERASWPGNLIDAP